MLSLSCRPAGEAEGCRGLGKHPTQSPQTKIVTAVLMKIGRRCVVATFQRCRNKIALFVCCMMKKSLLFGPPLLAHVAAFCFPWPPGWAGLVTPGRVATGLGTLATLRPAQAQHGDNEPGTSR